ncbi:MAG: endonuclease [Candidatus Eisenbacteria bacterium]|uniref:Endonuclease n=1 Tax=Eiseniibacteriota bacterium TaxID=2212470 RepID=A0A933W1Z7_UNCEI|nr:endonuclease [Candidatus Eisenbacteria bacterium]
MCDPLQNYQTDRFIEIYNSGPGPVDLTGWTLSAIANGSSSNTVTWTLSGTIAAGQAKVAGYTTPTTAFTVNFPSAAWTTTVAGQGSYNWNGNNDGAKLKNASGVTVDSCWSSTAYFTDKDLVRNASVGTGSLGYVASEWTATAVTLATSASPGSHNGSAPPAQGPTISGVVTIPAPPTAGTPTDVQATVTDPNSLPINAVTLSWGTTAGTLTNIIGMVNTTGNTYLTSSQIPGQAAGVVIYYRVTAEDDSATTQSAIQSYTIGGGGGGGTPATVTSVGEMSDSTLLVFFSEPVAQASAELPSNYTIGAKVAVNAIRDLVNTNQVWVTFRGLTAGTNTLTVNGVADLQGDITIGATKSFNYVDVTIPAGYYDGTAGLKGSALMIKLHNIIKGHTVVSYSSLLTWFQITDVKPNGKVWDIYSDIPGGTPPYEFTFGQTGNVSSSEGVTYNREHSTPQSWFNQVSPPVSDAFHIYPTDGKVNGVRSNDAYGVVATATYTSMNGSKSGPSATPGFTGNVFEPIDAFKGDCIRSSFYMATRYLFEDSAWPGGDPTVHAQLKPWAVAQYLQWHSLDPVSWKERMRNGAIYTFQHNRNPFIDHPEFLTAIYDSNSVAGVEPTPGPGRTAFLRPNSPNPFSVRTTIGFDLPRNDRVSLHIYDVTGREVRTLAAGRLMEAGSHQLEWDGRNDAGSRIEAGMYFCRIEVGSQSETRRIVFAR